LNVIIFREKASENKDRAALKPLKVFSCPGIKTYKLKYSIPKKTYDFCLITSANTFRFLKKIPHANTYVYIGKQTAKSAVAQKGAVLTNSNSEQILKFFKKKNCKGKSLIFPRSALGDPKLVRGLRKLGLKVSVRHIYGTRVLKLTTPLKKLHAKHKIGAHFVTSPSIVKAAVRAMRGIDWQGKWVAIGPTTARALREAGIRPLVASQASLQAMKKTLQQR
jgi:uroporphyrinogen-III synthase